MGSERIISESATGYNSVTKSWRFMSWQWSLKILEIVLLMSLMRNGNGYESGAPLDACRSLSPNHSPYPPQDPSVAASPYVVEIVGPKSEGHQEDFSIRLSGSDFRGFLLQVQNDQGSTVGQFVSGNKGSQFITCFMKNDSVTHTSGKLKREMEFTWRPSSVLSGKNYLKGTIVKTMKVFWTNVTFEFSRTPHGRTDDTENSAPQHDMNHNHNDL